MSFSDKTKQHLVAGLASQSAADEIESGVDSISSDISSLESSVSTNTSDISTINSKFQSGTTDGSGQIAVAGVTSANFIVATPQSDLGSDLVFSHAVAGAGVVTFYSKDVATSAVAVITGVEFGFIVI